MKDAVKSLLLIVISLLIATGFAWIYLRSNGSRQPLHPLPQAYFSGHPVPTLIALAGGSRERPENTFAAFDHACELGPEVALWADVQVDKDGTMVVFRDKDVARATGGSGWISYLSDAEVATLDAGYGFVDASGERPYAKKGIRVPTLREFMLRYPERRLVLNFMDYVPGLDDRIAALAEPLRAADRILFQSDIDGLTKDLRDKQPMWIYGPSQPQVARLLMLNSIGLASAASLRADAYVTPPRQAPRRGAGRGAGAREAPLIDDSLLAELKRRQIPVLAGPVRDEAEAQELARRGVAAVLAEAPSEMRFLLPAK
jgi:glycerophosphoryl diester phosphodiesterase